MEQKITLLEGDALEIMKGMPDDAGFDFVFMDAAKGTISGIFRTGDAFPFAGRDPDHG